MQSFQTPHFTNTSPWENELQYDAVSTDVSFLISDGYMKKVVVKYNYFIKEFEKEFYIKIFFFFFKHLTSTFKIMWYF